MSFIEQKKAGKLFVSSW